MIRSGAHTGDSSMLAFPALIVSSKPLDPDVQDPPGGFLWPRIYS